MFQNDIEEGQNKSVIIFYSSDGQAAKDRAAALKRSREVRVYQDTAWNGARERADEVVLMPCLAGWRRDKIIATFRDIIVEGLAAHEVGPINPKQRTAPPVQSTEPTGNPAAADTGAGDVADEERTNTGTTEEPGTKGEPRKFTLRQGSRGKWYVDDEAGVAADGPFPNKAAAQAAADALAAA